jgi:7-carboxy-7-deazaguanine synthase
MTMQVPSMLSLGDVPVVSEVFGPTFQGEGPSAGTRAGFVRFGVCNLTCSWCDTKYTWDWDQYNPRAELHRVVVEDLADRIEEMDVPLVVFTGGEPMLQQRHIIDVLNRLPHHMRAEIETNGTVVPQFGLLALQPRFNVSPKLANSGIPEKKRWKSRPLSLLNTEDSIFKFVVTHGSDLSEIANFQAVVGIDPSRIWVMPEGTDATTLVRGLGEYADGVLRRGWNLTTRLHVLAWGSERGK